MCRFSYKDEMLLPSLKPGRSVPHLHPCVCAQRKTGQTHQNIIKKLHNVNTIIVFWFLMLVIIQSFLSLENPHTARCRPVRDSEQILFGYLTLHQVGILMLCCV